MTHVAIIGGGPAGLAMAYCLGRRGIAYTVLERGTAPLAALRRLDPEMQLITPKRFSGLPGFTPPASAPEYMNFSALVEALEAWHVRSALPVVTEATVDAVVPAGAGFEVRYRRAGAPTSVIASHVVNATGMIGYPELPPDIPHDARIRYLHSRDVRTADLVAAERLLVVGAGMSAAEVIERRLEHRPDRRTWLSTRGRVRAMPQTVLGVDIHYWLWLPEHLPGRLAGRRLAPRRDLVIGRTMSRALHDARVVRVPPARRYEPDCVTLADATRLDPDLVVLATGYRYASEHLGDLVARDAGGVPIVDRHAASTRTANLYVLGVRFGRTIASSALRGIAWDAEHVADRIAT